MPAEMWRLLLLWAARCAASVDLEGFRALAQPVSPDAVHTPAYWQWYARYNTSLRADVAPLCGNGVLDTFATYTDYYTQHPPAAYGSEPQAWSYLIHEACDDGNRLDGDGCAADCLSLDALTPPCPLDGTPQLFADANESLRYVTFINDTTLLAVTSARRVVLADGDTWAPLAPAALLEVDVSTGLWDGTTVWLYASGAGQVLRLDAATGWQALRVLTLPVVVSGDNGVWWSESPGQAPKLVTASLQFVELRNATVRRASLNDDTRLPHGRLMIVLGARMDAHRLTLSCAFADLSSRSIQYDEDGSGALSDAGAPGTRADYENNFRIIPWMNLFIMRFFPHMLQEKTLARTRPYATYPAPSAPEPWNGDDTPTALAFGLYVQQLSVRTSLLQALVNDNGDFLIGVSDTKLRRAVMRQSSSMSCAGSTPCLLDVPVCYDVLSENPYANVDANATLYAAFVAAARSSAVTGALTDPATWAGILDAASQTTLSDAVLACVPPITQLLAHPVTDAIWVVRGAQVWEIGRRGTQVRLLPAEATCAPSYSGACPPGAWAPPRLACRPCASSAPDDRAWQQQCGGAGPGPNRRLLQVASQTIRFILASSGSLATVDQATAFVQSSINGSLLVLACEPAPAGRLWAYAYACNATLTDAPSALRALAAMVDGDTLAFLAAPHLLTLNAPASDAAAQAKDPVLGVGAVIGIVVGSVVVVGGFIGMFCLYEQHTTGYAGVPPSYP